MRLFKAAHSCVFIPLSFSNSSRTCFPHINMFFRLPFLPSLGELVPACREVGGGFKSCRPAATIFSFLVFLEDIAAGRRVFPFIRKSTYRGIRRVILIPMHIGRRISSNTDKFLLLMVVGMTRLVSPALCQSRCTSGPTALLQAGYTERIEPIK